MRIWINSLTSVKLFANLLSSHHKWSFNYNPICKLTSNFFALKIDFISIYIYIYIYTTMSAEIRICRLHPSPQKYVLGDKAPVLKFWAVWSHPFLPSSLWPEVVVPVRFPIFGPNTWNFITENYQDTWSHINVCKSLVLKTFAWNCLQMIIIIS